jgi:hypothetical protein
MDATNTQSTQGKKNRRKSKKGQTPKNESLTNSNADAKIKGDEEETTIE